MDNNGYNIFREILKELKPSKIEIISDKLEDSAVAKQFEDLFNYLNEHEKK